MPVALWQNGRSPGVIRATFLLMPVDSTSQRSVQVLGFDDISRFLLVKLAFCFQLPSDFTSQ
ncbi:hypothetical protein [Xenorhabdus sp. PB62.4]|uniref:hypothetical protein n=1 Tax=Xenorhabdus sp. PB62.4 TaxID=1851573 RepID=UPI001656D296|nr:hypothetical protein [Xenorhabdus sp. PB62.4]